MRTILERGSVFGFVVVLLLVVACQAPGSSPTPSSPPPSQTLSARVPAGEQDVPRIKPEELRANLDAGADVVVVDTRSLDSFQHNHIQGAISIPLPEIEARHEELPSDKEIVLYCT